MRTNRSSRLIIRRLAAYFLDCLLCFSVLIGLQALLYFTAGGFPFRLLTTGPLIELWVFATVSFPVWLYFSLNESSRRRATPGKRIMRLRVSSLQGERIAFGRALLRTIVKLLPWEITHLTIMLPVPWNQDPSAGFRPGLFVVYGLVAIYLASMYFNPQARSVDDLAAGTVVEAAPAGDPAGGNGH